MWLGTWGYDQVCCAAHSSTAVALAFSVAHASRAVCGCSRFGVLAQLSIVLPLPILSGITSSTTAASPEQRLAAARVFQDLVLGFQHSPLVFLRLVPPLTRFVDDTAGRCTCPSRCAIVCVWLGSAALTRVRPVW